MKKRPILGSICFLILTLKRGLKSGSVDLKTYFLLYTEMLDFGKARLRQGPTSARPSSARAALRHMPDFGKALCGKALCGKAPQMRGASLGCWGLGQVHGSYPVCTRPARTPGSARAAQFTAAWCWQHNNAAPGRFWGLSVRTAARMREWCLYR